MNLGESQMGNAGLRTFDIVWLAPLLCCCSVAPTAASQETGGHVRVLESFAIPEHGDVILLPVSVAGEEYPFAWDTGATLNVFDESLKPRLVERPRMMNIVSASENAPVALFAASPLYVGKLRLPVDVPVGCIDMSRLREVIGRDFYGILGASFHENLIVQIDFDEGKLLILAGHPLREKEEWGESVRFVPDAPWFSWVTASLDGVSQEQFMIDTGFSGTGELSQRLFDALAGSSRFTPIGETAAETVMGTKRLPLGRLASFSVGPFHHQDLIFGVSRRNKLGLAYLARYRVTFDFVAQKMYLKKGKRFSAPDHVDLSGLHVIRKSGRIEVDSVQRGSPADRAGIQAKDAIVGFEGRRGLDFDLLTIRRALGSAPGQRVMLAIDRAGKRIEVELRLEERQLWSNAPGPD